MIDARAEWFELRSIDRQTARLRVAAEAHQQLLTSLQRLQQVEAGEGSSRTDPVMLVDRNRNGGAAILLGQLGGERSHDALMPTVSTDDHHVLIPKVEPIHLLVRLRKNLAMQLFRRRVRRGILRKRLIHRAVPGAEQQRPHRRRIAEPPAGVQTRH